MGKSAAMVLGSMPPFWHICGLVFVAMVGSSCGTYPPAADVPSIRQGVAREYPVTLLPLGGPLADRDAEISGLAWAGDQLLLLPQYPGWNAPTAPSLFALSRTQLVDAVDGRSSVPLVPRSIPIVHGEGLQDIPGFEGFESIAVAGDRVFLTVETASWRGGPGYLVPGTLAPDLSELRLEPERRVPLEVPTRVSNAGFEAAVVIGAQLLVLFEGNGANLTSAPVALRFDLDLRPQGSIPVPNLEHRLTDATPGGHGRFWVSNYSYPGTRDVYRPAPDPLLMRFGTGTTHARLPQLERLIELELTPTGVQFTDTPPVLLELSAEAARNWEGVARLEERGFLLVTDKFPGTLLGFVAMP